MATLELVLAERELHVHTVDLVVVRLMNSGAPVDGAGLCAVTNVALAMSTAVTTTATVTSLERMA